MTLVQSDDGPFFHPQQIALYRQLSFRLLEDKALRTWHGLQGVALGRDGIILLVERDDDRYLNHELLRAIGRPDVGLKAVGLVQLSGSGGERIDAASGCWGTFGCVVNDDQRRDFVLTCDHVAGHQAGQSIGDDVDCGLSKLGTFTRGSTISISAAASNTTDAALVSPPLGVTLRKSIKGMKPAPYGSNRSLRLGEDVKKSGACTGVTNGRFVYIVTMLVPYPAGLARLVDQIGIDGGGTVFSDRGDSGAALLDSQSRVAGLVFASAPQACLGFANPISEVETVLGVTVL